METHIHIHVHPGAGGAGDVSAQKIGDGQLLKSIIEILIQLGIIKVPVPTTGVTDPSVSAKP